MLTGCLKNDLHDIKNFTLFKKISKIFQKSLDFSIFLYYNQLTSRPEFQQWTGQSQIAGIFYFWGHLWSGVEKLSTGYPHFKNVHREQFQNVDK